MVGSTHVPTLTRAPVGVCYKHLKQYRPAREALLRSLQLHQHERTYEQLGQVALLQNDVQDAITTYQQATE